MLTIDEYIAKKKRADKLDEFDYSNQSENMAAVMKYKTNTKPRGQSLRFSVVVLSVFHRISIQRL